MSSAGRTPFHPICLWTTVILILAGLPAQGAQITHTFHFDPPSWAAAPDGRVGFEVPSIAGARTIGQPGQPLLPVYSAQILLPPGEEIVALRTVSSSAAEVERHLPAPADYEHPLSLAGPYRQAAPDPTIYGSGDLFPAQPAQLATVQTYRGHRIAYVNLFPLRVRAGLGEVAFSSTLTLEVTTAPQPDVARVSGVTYRDDAATQAWLERRVVNPEAIAAYAAAQRAGQIPRPTQPARTLVDPAETKLYVIVTTAALAPAYEPLAADRTSKGLPAAIVTIEDILATYAGRDNPERLRSFVLDAYQNWETEYILFGADSPAVPDRDCYCYVVDEGSPVETNDLCCELYFEGLDGTWNDDGDDRWGEAPEADLLPEVHTARLCADNVGHVQAFITKLLRYERQPVVSEIGSAAFLGEYLWEGTYGDWYMEEIRLGANTWGYTTAGVPADWTTFTYYEETGSWSGTTFINRMNAGTHMAHHLGHANSDYDVKVYTSDVPAFTSNGITHTYNFGYSQGCHAGEFDNTDCIMEEWVKSPTGFVAWVGNTRYGFGVHYTTNGSSQYYHRQFADALWAEGINELAAANDDSRADNVGYIDYESNRWVHYEITAFGDPAMPVWTDTPQAPQLEHAGVFVLGSETYTVVVRAGGAPVGGARVCMWDEAASTYAYGVTDATGRVIVALDPALPGTMHIVVSDADLLVTETTIPILPGGPYIVIDSHSISDVGGGNGDGNCDAGETIDLAIALRNVWTGPITGVYATLSCDNPHATILDGMAQYGDFAGGQSKPGQGGDHFVFHIAGDCSDLESLEFTLTIRDDHEGVWSGSLSYPVDAPTLSVAGLVLDDTAGGDGDRCLDPGESAEITVTLANNGHEDALTVQATLHSGSGALLVTQPSASGGDIPPGGAATLAPDFAVWLDPGAPSPGLIHCTLVVNGDWELQASLPIDLAVGGLRDDMEFGEGSWTHQIITPGFADQWHLSSQRNHTPGGSHSWKFGSTGVGTYANLSDGALITPPITIRENTVLTFWHWIDAEVSQSYPGRCYDGGLVEMSLDEGPWEQIAPTGGYPYTIRAGGTPGPFPEGTPVFSGTHDWQAVQFLVESAEGEARFRFRFGSDGADGAEGWYIDDLEILSWDQGAFADEQIPALNHVWLAGNRPNPFAAGTEIRFLLPAPAGVNLLVLDTQGRALRTLVSGRLPAGVHRVAWDGCDAGGRTVGSGVYFYRLESEGAVQTRKMTLLR